MTWNLGLVLIFEYSISDMRWWSLWAKGCAVGKSSDFSTASNPVQTHRPQIHGARC